MEHRLILRQGRADEAARLADFIVMTDRQMVEFLHPGADAGSRAADATAAALAGGVGPLSHSGCLVAEAGGTLVGMVALCPVTGADIIGDGPRRDRCAHLKPLNALVDPGGLRIAALAVEPPWQRCGVGGRLLLAAVDRAAADGFDRLLAPVWADAAGTLRFYRRHGFEEAGRAALPWHPLLPHVGGMVMMRRGIERRRTMPCTGGDTDQSAR